MQEVEARFEELGRRVRRVVDYRDDLQVRPVSSHFVGAYRERRSVADFLVVLYPDDELLVVVLQNSTGGDEPNAGK